ncbi:MAG: ATP-binding cassette domain-containing protein [Clostridiales bacterium]|nr:ATP-binding cassette domain-containing protein [Clostridiales bacterium]
MATIQLKHINKIYDGGVHAVHDFSIDIAENEFIAFVGPSGCGKSTTLRMIAGLEEISTGEMYIDGQLVNNVAPKDRGIAMVFQSYALYPQMTVYNNMAYSLKLHKVPKDVIDRRVRGAANILKLTPYLDRKPRALSGGQRQRVALGRAIVREPKVFLMDEPLSNLDAKLRVAMRSEIVRIHKAVNATTIYVTHDQIEAMTMADRIVIMKDGIIQQIATPDELYKHPANVFVAGFIGTPAMNLFHGEKHGDEFVTDAKVFTMPNEGVKVEAEFVRSVPVDAETAVESEQQAAEEFKAPPPNSPYEYPINIVPSAHGKVTSSVAYAAADTKVQLTVTPDFGYVIKSVKVNGEDITDNCVKIKLTKEQQKLLENYEGKRIIYGIRPENLIYEKDEKFDRFKNYSFAYDVQHIEMLGDIINMHGTIGESKVISKTSSEFSVKVGDVVTVAVDPSHTRFFNESTLKAINEDYKEYEEIENKQLQDEDNVVIVEQKKGFFARLVEKIKGLFKKKSKDENAEATEEAKPAEGQNAETTQK